MNEDFLTTQEIDTIILALADGRQSNGFTEAEATFAVNWARQIRLGNIMLDLLLKGTGDQNTHAVIDVVPRVDVRTIDVAMSIHTEDHAYLNQKK